MAQHDYTQDDQFRGLSPYDFARLLIAILGSSDAPGVVLLGLKTTGAFEQLKSDDSGRLQVHSDLTITNYLRIPLKSQYTNTVTLTTAAGDKTLPSITIQGLPSGATVFLALPWIKARIIENTHATLVNSLSGAQYIQAEKAVGGAWVSGISFGGGEFSTPATLRENGDVAFGDGDISAQIPGNGAVLDFKWALGLSAQDNLVLHDVQVGVDIFCSF